MASAEPALINNPNIEWIVVDNEQANTCKEALSHQYAFVKIVQMGYNAGFARANNAGMKIAKGEYILLLNPDTLLQPNSIINCLNLFASSNHVACGIQLVYPNNDPQFSGSKFVKGGLNHLLELPFWGPTIKFIASAVKIDKPAIIKANNEQLVDWVSGAFLMVKKQAINKVGLMDEDFFLYAEEVEWCSRLAKMGTICLYGDLRIIHLIGTSIQIATASKDNSYTNLSDIKGLQLMVSNHLRIRKQYGVFWFLLLLINYTWAIPFSFFTSFFYNIFKLKNPFFDFNYLSGFAILPHRCGQRLHRLS